MDVEYERIKVITSLDLSQNTIGDENTTYEKESVHTRVAVAHCLLKQPCDVLERKQEIIQMRQQL